MAQVKISVVSVQDAMKQWYAIASITFPTQQNPTELRGEYTHKDKWEAEQQAINKLKSQTDYKRLIKQFG